MVYLDLQLRWFLIADRCCLFEVKGIGDNADLKTFVYNLFRFNYFFVSTTIPDKSFFLHCRNKTDFTNQHQTLREHFQIRYYLKIVQGETHGILYIVNYGIIRVVRDSNFFKNFKCNYLTFLIRPIEDRKTRVGIV